MLHGIINNKTYITNQLINFLFLVYIHLVGIRQYVVLI
jgi:hypothetical protein